MLSTMHTDMKSTDRKMCKNQVLYVITGTKSLEKSKRPVFCVRDSQDHVRVLFLKQPN